MHPVPGHQQRGGHCNSQIEELSVKNSNIAAIEKNIFLKLSIDSFKITTETSSKTEVMTKALEEVLFVLQILIAECSPNKVFTNLNSAGVNQTSIFVAQPQYHHISPPTFLPCKS